MMRLNTANYKILEFLGNDFIGLKVFKWALSPYEALKRAVYAGDYVAK